MRSPRQACAWVLPALCLGKFLPVSVSQLPDTGVRVVATAGAIRRFQRAGAGMPRASRCCQ